MGGRGQPVIGPITSRHDKGSAGFKKKSAKSDFFCNASFDQETVAFGDRLALDEPVALIRAEGRNIDRSQWVGGLEPEPAAGTHSG
jgi:hypothetical protein